ncbi:hypothetical protein NKW54_08425 [Acetobacter cerevisiae]|uniref:Tail fiber protein n=1 Tax=Acetobacter cerevisiae TaxID=178900 RepID=A0ABT1ERF2_9PROT|nr:hypothetical protein [Acetobacter cerevisiae]MCP1245963.1 hypothetical protein [Acetobacter cerevisiae]MCP1255681.1 hypothetical protein [Acetobacter cerevisiae]
MDLLIAPNTVSLAEADTAPTTGTPGYATDGNPTTGSPRTPFPAYAWNAIQIEVTTVITKAGLALNRDDNTLLYQAIQKLVAEGEAEAAVGYTPVEQGGTAGLASDKINIGNSSNGLSAYISGKLWGVFASQAWAKQEFVTNNTGENGGITQAAIDANTLGPSFLDGNGTWHLVQSYGSCILNTNVGLEGSFAGTSLCVSATENGERPLLAYNGNSRIGTIAWLSDVVSEASQRTTADENLQEQINNKIDSSLISYGTIDSGYYTKIGNILRQTFDVTLTPDSNGNVTITFPQAYSSPPKVIGMGSVETTQNHSAIAINQTNSGGVLTSATQAFLHFSTGAGTSSVQQSVVNITVEGIA